MGDKRIKGGRRIAPPTPPRPSKTQRSALRGDLSAALEAFLPHGARALPRRAGDKHARVLVVGQAKGRSYGLVFTPQPPPQAPRIVADGRQRALTNKEAETLYRSLLAVGSQPRVTRPLRPDSKLTLSGSGQLTVALGDYLTSVGKIPSGQVQHDLEAVRQARLTAGAVH